MGHGISPEEFEKKINETESEAAVEGLKRAIEEAEGVPPEIIEEEILSVKGAKRGSGLEQMREKSKEKTKEETIH